MHNASSEAQNKMLTEVILEGELGKEFGEKWNLAVNTPGEAIRMINANDRRFTNWIRDNRHRVAGYSVICENENGIVEELNMDNFIFNRKMKRMTITPIPYGAGGHTNWTQVLEGAALITAAYFTGGTSLAFMSAPLAGVGATLMLQGFITGLTPTQSSADSNSFYFDGPTNTSQQGNPVPIVYGRMMTGSQAVSVSLQVDQMM